VCPPGFEIFADARRAVAALIRLDKCRA